MDRPSRNRCPQVKREAAELSVSGTCEVQSCAQDVHAETTAHPGACQTDSPVLEAAAFEASASIRAQSRAAKASAGLSHEPPAHSTLGCSRYDLTVSCVMPPVGQKRASGKGPANAFSIGMPPAAPAGKNLKHRYPAARPLISSDAVATAGR